MTKLLCETTGEFELVDYGQNAIIVSDRPTVLNQSTFVSQRAAVGQIRILESQLSDEATDAEFEKYFNDSDKNTQLAIDSFKAAYSVQDATPTQSPNQTVKPKRGGNA